MDSRSSRRHGYMITGNPGTTLLDAIRLWATPLTADAKRGLDTRRQGDAQLVSQVKLWATPDAQVSNDGESPESWRARQARWKATYDARAPGETKAGNGAGVPLAIAAKEWVLSRLHPTTGPDGRATSSDGLVLNPRFVEALMGLPHGWTSCAPVGTASFRSWLQSHGCDS